MITLTLLLLLAPQDIDRLIDQLESDEIAVREKAAEKLKKMGKKALGYLREVHLTTPDAEVRARLNGVIAQIEIRFAQPTRMVYTKDKGIGSELYLWEDGKERCLTNNKKMEAGPVFSPDGKQIAYFSMEKVSGGWKNADVRVMTLDGGSTDLGKGIEPAWSPDGKRIAISTNGKIRIVDPDGKNEKIFDGTARDLTWSGDGKRLAFESGNRIRILHIAGEKSREVLDRRKEFRTLYNWSWASDGETFALVAGQGPYNWDVWTIGANGKGLDKRTERAWIGHGIVQFSPDGKRAAVCVRLGSGMGKPGRQPGMLDDGLHILNLETGLWTKAALDVNPILRPRWSPDGKFIIYVAKDYSIRIGRSGGGVTRVLSEMQVPYGSGAMWFPPDAYWENK